MVPDVLPDVIPNMFRYQVEQVSVVHFGFQRKPASGYSHLSTSPCQTSGLKLVALNSSPTPAEKGWKTLLTWHTAAGASTSVPLVTDPDRVPSSSSVEVNGQMQRCSSECMVCTSWGHGLRTGEDQLSCLFPEKSQALDLDLTILAIPLGFSAARVCW